MNMDNNGIPPIDESAMQEALCKAIEEALHQKMESSGDFHHLSEMLFSRTREMISPTTLKRVWGKIHPDYGHSPRTLNTMAQFLGYTDFHSFCQQTDANGLPPSNEVLSEHINVASDLHTDEELILYWAPCRVCHVRYQGNLSFVVTSSENTRLQPGDTFCCSLIIKGEPLFLSQLVQNGRPPVSYVCGKKGGIRYECMSNKT